MAGNLYLLGVIFHLFSKDLVPDSWLSHVYTQRSSRPPPVNVPLPVPRPTTLHPYPSPGGFCERGFMTCLHSPPRRAFHISSPIKFLTTGNFHLGFSGCPDGCLLVFTLISHSISVLSVNVSCDVVAFSGVLQRMPKEKCVADDLLRSPREAHTEHIPHPRPS